MIKSLDWDTAFFGFSVAQAIADSPEECWDLARIAHKNGAQLVYGYCPADRVTSVIESWIVNSLICTHVTFESQANAVQPHLEVGYTLHYYCQNSPEANLLKLAIGAGGHSRFRIDGRFPAVSFERMYAIWVTRCVAGELADVVYEIRDPSNEIAGFATGIVKSDGTCVLGLIAVSEAHQKRGLGRSLVAAIIRFAADRGASTVEVTTQATNLPAIRLYEGTGFRVKSRQAVFHFWSDETESVS